jgi:hypothetical protein
VKIINRHHTAINILNKTGKSKMYLRFNLIRVDF